MSPVDAPIDGVRARRTVAPPSAPACLYKTTDQVTIKACGACDRVATASLRQVRGDAARCVEQGEKRQSNNNNNNKTEESRATPFAVKQLASICCQLFWPETVKRRSVQPFDRSSRCRTSAGQADIRKCRAVSCRRSKRLARVRSAVSGARLVRRRSNSSSCRPKSRRTDHRLPSVTTRPVSSCPCQKRIRVNVDEKIQVAISMAT